MSRRIKTRVSFSPACIPCLARQVENTFSLLKSNGDKNKVWEVIQKDFLKLDFILPPVVFGWHLYEAIRKTVKKQDIFCQTKKEINRWIIYCRKQFAETIVQDKAPLYKAAVMSAAANAIDFGAGISPNLNKIMKNLLKAKLTIDNYHLFEKKLKKAKLILFLGDNCGEAFFDKLFIEEVKKQIKGIQVVYAVRKKPILNDITQKEAKQIELHKVAKIISSGCPFPGIVFEYTNKKFKEICFAADIIISKGQGNFESFVYPIDKVFYLFQVKCPTVVNIVKKPIGSILFLKG